MAKRKIDCSLDDIVMEYFKKVKCEKSSKMFGTDGSSKNDHSESLKKFIKFLKENETEKENRIEDDLGFEINFGVFQPATKLPAKEKRKPLTDKALQGPKKEPEKRKIDIPKDFIKKIKKLGMKVEDVEVLFRSKIDWCAVYSENKIYCPEPACDFSTTIDKEDLTNHMINVHEYGQYPCDHDHCNYVAASKRLLVYHAQMHKKRFESNFWYKCSKPNCQSTFSRQILLNCHMRIHNNELDKCQYCPYRYLEPPRYIDHLNRHFGIKDHICEQCGAKFSAKRHLTQHALIHEGIIYCCLICNTFESKNKDSMHKHLRKKHSDLLGNSFYWDSVKNYVKMK